MKRIISVFTLITLLSVGAIALKTRYYPEDTATKGTTIVTSFYPLYFFTKEIAGNKFEVVNLTPAGVEPHDYEPTTKDVAHLEESPLVILNGAGLESWSSKINPSQSLVVSDGLATETDPEESAQDPHIWLDPVLAQTIVDKIASRLSIISPSNKDYFSERANSLIVRLSDLDREYSTSTNGCKQQNIVTSHSAFGYLAKRYHFNQIAITGLSPDEEPTAQKMSDITKLINQKDIHFIFFETLVSPRLAQTLSKETGTQTLVFNPIEGLTEEELQMGQNYFSIQEENILNLKKALECR